MAEIEFLGDKIVQTRKVNIFVLYRNHYGLKENRIPDTYLKNGVENWNFSKEFGNKMFVGKFTLENHKTLIMIPTYKMRSARNSINCSIKTNRK